MHAQRKISEVAVVKCYLFKGVVKDIKKTERKDCGIEKEDPEHAHARTPPQHRIDSTVVYKSGIPESQAATSVSHSCLLYVGTVPKVSHASDTTSSIA